MSAAADQANFPTMIIPRGTEIRVNASGQLSIKTPGNLVIQNSGVYSEIESTNGSIRIEENVTVEAVSVRAGQACFIQGTLTAWKVHAKRIALEDKARAFIMLQESEQLELAKTSRLVGNFSNEKELFFMMGKYSPQLKELPGSVDMSAQPRELNEQRPAPKVSASSGEEDFRAAQMLIERELARHTLPFAAAEAMRELLFALRERNVQRVATIWREAFTEVTSPDDMLREAYTHLENFFGRTA